MDGPARLVLPTGFRLGERVGDELPHVLVTERAEGTTFWCKPYLVRNKAQFPKTAFAFDAAGQRLTCPAGVTRPGVPGQTVHFPAERCDPPRPPTVTSRRGALPRSPLRRR